MSGKMIFAALLSAAFIGFVTPASAQTSPSFEIVLKSGETAEVTELWYMSACKSLMKSTPEVEVLDGPPGVTAVVTQKMVLPRNAGCSKRISGALLSVKAGEITEDSTTDMRIRVRYNTVEGRRDRGMTIRVVLIAS